MTRAQTARRTGSTLLLAGPAALFGLALAAALATTGCGAPSRTLDVTASDGAPQLFLDVHRMGPGAVTLADVAAAHEQDLVVQHEHGVDYLRYWVDEAEGLIYCLAAAPSAEAAEEVHRAAHGLVADEIVAVRPGILPAAPLGRGKLFLDTHDAGPGAVTYADVADAHRQDLAVQERFGVRFLEYWIDEESGRIHCLAEAPSAEAFVETHRAAHGLLPDELHEVVRGE